MRKGLLIAILALIAIVLVAGVSLRRYLQSQHGAGQVAARLEAIVGAKVQVGQADIGLNHTTLQNLALPDESNTDVKSEPWLKVGSLVADLSLWDLVRGNAEPKLIELQNVKLLLRFDANGNLLTRLPLAFRSGDSASTTALPELVLESGEIVLRKAGYSDLLLTNVSARLTNEAGKAVLTGGADSAELGKLNLSGSFENALAVVQLKTQAKARFSQEFLERVPLVPAVTWTEIRIDAAESMAELTLRLDLKTSKYGYRVELHPENAKLFLPVLDLPAQNASFALVVEDNRIEIRNVQGDAFGGQIRGEADLDFREAVYKLAFKKIEVDGLDVRDLPDDWNIPNVVRKSIANGKLHGNAAVEVTITPRPLTPVQLSALQAITGSASGFNPAAMAIAWPGADVHFRTKGRGQVRDPEGKQDAVEFDWQLKPRRMPLAKTLPVTGSIAPSTDAIAVNDAIAINAKALFAGLFTVMLQQAKEQPKYLDLNLGLKNVDLAALVENLNLKLPIGVSGKLSFDVKASVPTDRPDEMKAYKAVGNATIKALVIGDTHVDEISAAFVYGDGILTLKSLDGKLANDGGTFKGNGSMDVVPQGDLRAELIVDRIAVNQLVSLGSEKMDGAFSGKIRISAPVQKLSTLSAFSADGTVSSDRLKIFGLGFEKVHSSIKLKDAVLKLPDLRVQMEGTPVGAAAELRLTDAYDFEAKMDLRDWNLAFLQKLTGVDKTSLPTFAGAFSTTLDLRGQLAPFKFSASGETATQNLSLDAFAVESVKFRWETDGQRLNFKDVDATLYGGQATGTAVLPFDPSATGNLDLNVKDLNVKKLVKDLKMPFAMDGNVGGQLKGTFPPVEKGKERTATLHLDLNAPKMRVQNIPAEKLVGTVAYEKGAIDYKLKGSTLGGTFDLEGQIPSNAKPADELKKQESKKGRLLISGVQIARLFQSLGASYSDSVHGGLSIDINYTHDPGDPYPEGRGVVRISDLRWKDKLLSDNLQGDIILTEQQIRVRNLTASIAEGTFSLQVAYYLRQSERSWFSAKFNRVEAEYLLGPWFGDQIEGPMQVHLRGKLGGEWHGTADLQLERGKAFGLQLSQWRVPINWSYAPSQTRGKLEIHDSAAQLARGRATAKMNLSWGDTVRVEGQIKLASAELKDILTQTVGSSEWGSGQTTARFDFAGDNVRSINDINGNLVASFRQTQALQVPVLKQVAPLIGLGRSTTFQSGSLRANLTKGVFRIQQLALDGTNVQMHVDGTVALNGRLNLEVVARTNTLGLPTDRLRLLGLRIPTAGPVPLTVLQETSNLLSNRVIYLQVTGTAQNPNIRVQPLRQLSEEAVRYFLRIGGVPVVPNL